MPESLLPSPELPAYTPQECFQRISRRLRATLKRGRIPMVSWGPGTAGLGLAGVTPQPHPQSCALTLCRAVPDFRGAPGNVIWCLCDCSGGWLQTDIPILADGFS